VNGCPPPAAECLELLAPTPEEVDLLRTCLWRGPAAYAAWGRWQRTVGDPLTAFQRDVSGVKALLPLLHRGLQGSDTNVATSAVRHALGAAYARETVRWQAYAAVCARAFDPLAAARIAFLVLKGAALAVSVYPKPAMRHSHDIDVLIDAGDVDRAAAVLQTAGFAPARHFGPPAARSMRLVSPEQVPIELHTRPYRLPYYATAGRGMWDRATRCEVAGMHVRTPSAADHLVYVCGQACCSASRDALKWVADAWFLAQDRNLEWSMVAQIAEENRLALPLSVMLQVLADRFEAPVPTTVLARLATAAAAADRCAQQIAIAGLRAGRRGRLRDLFRATSTWRGRMALACWLLAPSPTALRLGEPLRYPRAWPAYYLLRPPAYAARRVRRQQWFSSHT
jgi:hypothetical protein